jgi:hypothetical protein
MAGGAHGFRRPLAAAVFMAVQRRGWRVAETSRTGGSAAPSSEGAARGQAGGSLRECWTEWDAEREGCRAG